MGISKNLDRFLEQNMGIPKNFTILKTKTLGIPHFFDNFKRLDLNLGILKFSTKMCLSP